MFLIQTIRTHKLVAFFILVAMGGGMGLVWLHQINYGVGVSPDAILYVSVAENLSVDRGFARQYGGPYGYPPLFPSLLTLTISLTAENGFYAARYVNIGIFGLTIIAALVWVSPKLHSKFWLVWASAICALSPALIHISSYARTDSLYVLFAVLSLYKLDRWLTQVKQSDLIWAAVFASLSCLTRYTGFAVILTALLMISLKRGITLWAKARYMNTYLLISALPSVIWMLRNYFKFGRLTPGHTSENDLLAILYNSARGEFTKMVLGDLGDRWLLSERLGITVSTMRNLFLVFSAAILGAGIVYLYRKGIGGGLAVPLVFVLIYILFLSASWQLDIAAFFPRYLFPMYVPLLVIVIIVVDRSLRIFSQSIKWPLILRRNISKAVGPVALGFMILLVPPTIKSIKEWQENGISFASKYWVESEINRYIDSITISGIVYTNKANVLSTHMDITDKTRVSFRPLPRSLSHIESYYWDDRDYFWEDRDRGHELDRHVIWYTEKYPATRSTDPRYDILTIASLSGLKIAAILEGGVVLADEGFEPALLLDVVLKDAQLMVRSEFFDVYLDDSRIIYLADLCREVDGAAPLFLHTVPANLDDLPDRRKTLNALDVSFDSHDFNFNGQGFRFGERCAAIRNLPDYDFELIITGQYTLDGDTLWKEEIYKPVQMPHS